MTDRKIFPLMELAALLARDGADRRTVLMNGVFDLLHVGHVRALREARGMGDRLVVAINDDDSAYRLKGEGRPFQSEDDRAEILAALACVDFVTIFAEDTVAATLRALRPAVHAKGSDYNAKDLPQDERDAAQELGIDLALVGGPKAGSSSALAARAGGRR